MTRAELESKIAVLLGGRAAESLVLGELSTGAADDLAKATEIAHEMVARYGMDEGLGPVTYEAPRPLALDVPAALMPNRRLVSEDTLRRIDEAVRAIVGAAFGRATQLLARERAALERCAAALLEHETLDEAAIRSLAPDLQNM